MSDMGKCYEKKCCDRDDVIENDLGLYISGTAIFSKFTFEI